MQITLDQARVEMLAKAGAGTDCPCCGRLAKAYIRILHSTMARYLIEIAVAQSQVVSQISINDMGEEEIDDWVDVTGLSVYKSGGQRGDYSYMKHWKLIEPKQNFDTRKRTSGFWRVTQLGLEFVQGRVSVPKHVVLLFGKPIAWGEDRIYIIDALGDTFDYQKLMGPLMWRNRA